MSLHSQPIKFRLKDIIFTALIASIVFVTQIVMAALPNIEIVSFLFIIYAIHFPLKQSLTASYIFCLLEGLFFGFGIWWVMYLYVWQILIIISWSFRKMNFSVFWAVIAGIFGLFFGALCSIPYIVAGGFFAGFAWWVNGIFYDVIHAISNFLIMLALYRPMSNFFKKIILADKTND